MVSTYLWTPVCDDTVRLADGREAKIGDVLEAARKARAAAIRSALVRTAHLPARLVHALDARVHHDAHRPGHRLA